MIERIKEKEKFIRMILTDQKPDNDNFPLVYYHVIELQRKENQIIIKIMFFNLFLIVVQDSFLMLSF
jgi:hypothetical protein